MKLIKQSFEILEQKDFTLKGIKQFIEIMWSPLAHGRRNPKSRQTYYYQRAKL